MMATYLNYPGPILNVPNRNRDNSPYPPRIGIPPPTPLTALTKPSRTAIARAHVKRFSPKMGTRKRAPALPGAPGISLSAPARNSDHTAIRCPFLLHRAVHPIVAKPANGHHAPGQTLLCQLRFPTLPVHYQHHSESLRQ